MRHHPHPLLRALGVLPATLAACLGTTQPLEPPPEPPARPAARMVATLPTAHYSVPGMIVAGPAVRLVDADGEPVPDVPVTFSSVSGSGHLESRVVPTNPLGVAGTRWVLGPQPGEHLVVATAEGVAPLAFAAVSGFEAPSHVFGLARAERRWVAEGEVLGGYYLLFPDGAFTRSDVLGGPAGQYPVRRDAGTWSHEGGVITFIGSAGSWTATVGNDSLYVERHQEWDPAVYSAAPLATACTADQFPPIAPPAVSYRRQSPHRYPAGAASRYVLLDDRTFSLQYITPAYGLFEYTGKYTQADSVITFAFDAWSASGEWRATGLLRGATLTVSYNLIMSWDDFEDGVYTTQQCGDGTGR